MTDVHQLARDVADLRQRLDELREDIDYVIAVCEPAPATTGIGALPPAASTARQPTRAHTWDSLTGHEAADAWTQLTTWTDWLRRRYQLEDTIPDCWYQHGAIVDELDALRAAWTGAYVNSNAGLADAAFWLEQLGRALPRLREFDRYGCAAGVHRDDPAPPDEDSARQQRARHLHDDVARRIAQSRQDAHPVRPATAGGDVRGDVRGDGDALG